MNAAVQPRREHTLQQRTLSLEAVRPTRVVRNDDDDVVRSY